MSMSSLGSLLGSSLLLGLNIGLGELLHGLLGLLKACERRTTTFCQNSIFCEPVEHVGEGVVCRSSSIRATTVDRKVLHLRSVLIAASHTCLRFATEYAVPYLATSLCIFTIWFAACEHVWMGLSRSRSSQVTLPIASSSSRLLFRARELQRLVSHWICHVLKICPAAEVQRASGFKCAGYTSFGAANPAATTRLTRASPTPG